MIEEVVMFGAQCDNCKEDWEDVNHGWVALNDKGGLTENLVESGWHVETDGEERCYCPECHSIGDEDELIINADRIKIKPM